MVVIVVVASSVGPLGIIGSHGCDSSELNSLYQQDALLRPSQLHRPQVSHPLALLDVIHSTHLPIWAAFFDTRSISLSVSDVDSRTVFRSHHASHLSVGGTLGSIQPAAVTSTVVVPKLCPARVQMASLQVGRCFISSDHPPIVITMSCTASIAACSQTRR